MQHVLHNKKGIRNRVRSKKDPTEEDEMERDEDSQATLSGGNLVQMQDLRYPSSDALGHVGDHQVRSMQGSPHHKGPIRAMPQSAH